MSPDIAERPHFQQVQFAFTASVRNPDEHAGPDDIKRQRMGIYQELLYNSIEDQFANNFPVLRKITPDERWHAMIRDYMIKHRAVTPLFTEVGQEFLDYLRIDREAQASDWPFMLELAHYEWVELAVMISTADEDISDFDPNGDLLSGRPLVSPVAWNLSYQWPVHQIGPDHLPEEAPGQPTHLVVYRDRQHEVHFLEINPVTQRLLTLLKENPELTGLDAVKQIAGELQHPQPEAVINAGTELLHDLKARQIIVGTRS